MKCKEGKKSPRKLCRTVLSSTCSDSGRFCNIASQSCGFIYEMSSSFNDCVPQLHETRHYLGLKYNSKSPALGNPFDIQSRYNLFSIWNSSVMIHLHSVILYSHLSSTTVPSAVYSYSCLSQKAFCRYWEFPKSILSER